MPFVTGQYIAGFSSSPLCPTSLRPLVSGEMAGSPSDVFSLEVAYAIDRTVGAVHTVEALTFEPLYSTQMSSDVATLFGFGSVVDGDILHERLWIYDIYDHTIHPVKVRIHIVDRHGPKLFLFSWKSLEVEFDWSIGYRHSSRFLDLVAKRKKRCKHLLRNYYHISPGSRP